MGVSGGTGDNCWLPTVTSSFYRTRVVLTGMRASMRVSTPDSPYLNRKWYDEHSPITLVRTAGRLRCCCTANAMAASRSVRLTNSIRRYEMSESKQSWSFTREKDTTFSNTHIG